MTESGSRHISFVSSSYHSYDRRMQRIILSLSNYYKIKWYSRQLDGQKQNLSYEHVEIRCFFSSGILFYLEFNIRLLIKLLSAKTDLISAVDIDSLSAAYLAARIKNKKLVFDAHEIFHEVPELESKKMKKWIWKRLSQELFSRVKYKYTVNSSLKDIFKELFNTDFEIIRNVPELKPLNKMPEPGAKKLVYLGAVNTGRGLELAIRSLIDLKDHELMVLGSGDEIEHMHSLARDLKVDDRIEFCGYVKPVDIFERLSECSVALNLLDPKSDNYKYSLANKFFDYVHACLPSVNMQFVEYQKLNDEYEVSCLIKEYDLQSLIRAVKYIEEPDNYKKIQNNCMSARQKWNWQIESKKLIDIYIKAFKMD